MKGRSTSRVIKETQIESQGDAAAHAPGRLKRRERSAGEDGEEMDPSHAAGGSRKRCQKNNEENDAALVKSRLAVLKKLKR